MKINFKTKGEIIIRKTAIILLFIIILSTLSFSFADKEKDIIINSNNIDTEIKRVIDIKDDLSNKESYLTIAKEILISVFYFLQL